MIGKKMEDAVNGQIGKELYSAYLYLAMSGEAALMGLKGAANWFYIQYQEETVHAMKLRHHLLEQGAAVTLEAVAKPKAGFKSLLDMFQATLKHEQFITRSINDLMELALKEKDFASQNLLRWYVDEQIEEEANDNEIIGMLKLAGGSGGSLLMIDRTLGKREFKA